MAIRYYTPQKNFPRFLVVGAGNGGRAMAAFIVQRGYHVDLYNRSLEHVQGIKQEGGIWANVMKLRDPSVPLFAVQVVV